MALVEGCKHSLEIEVPAEDVDRETQRAVAKISSKVRLPGFRPGKAPANLVKTRFAGDIRQEVVEALVPRYFQSAVDEEHLQVVGRPNFTDIDIKSGEPLRFKAEFEVAPTFELGEYRGIAVPYAEPQVTEADVDERIEQIRERKAEYVNEDPRPLADGDYAVVSLESLEGVDEKISQDEMVLKIGDEETLDAFSENLRGVSPEESREFDITYPDDYDREALAGHTVKFRAQVKAVRRKELPEINDEFAKDLGDYQTMDELRDAIRKGIFQEREYRAQEAAKHELIDKLVEAHEFPVPEAYVDRQIEMNLNNQLRNLGAQGVDVSQLKLDWAKVKESQQERATRDVRGSLLLDKIGEREAIGATQDEVDREVQRLAQQRREAVAVTRATLEKEGAIGRIAGHIRTEKTLNFLFEHATKEVPEEAPEGEDSDSEEPGASNEADEE